MTKRIKVKLIGKGVVHDPFRVNLPNYIVDCKRDKNGNPIYVNEVMGEKEDSCDYINKKCYVLVPDDEVKENGKLDQDRIRKKYKKNWSNFDKSKVEI